MKKLLVIALMVSTSAFAQSFSPLINSLSSPQSCELVPAKEFQKFLQERGLQNYRPDFINTRRFLPKDNFQRLIYLKSIEQFKSKQACLKDYSQQVMNSEEALKESTKTLAVVWLNKKKSQLILNQCREMQRQLTQMHIDVSAKQWASADELKTVEKNYLKNSRRFDLKYYDVCKNKDSLVALKGLIKLSERALPFLSSKKILKILEEERSLILLKSQNRALKDSDLLDLDLTAKKVLSFDKARLSNLTDKLKNLIQDNVAENEDKMDRLNERDLSGLNELYADGTVNEVLRKLGLNEETLSSNKSMTTLYMCLKNDYEPSFIGSMLDFFLLMAITKNAIGATAVVRALPAVMQESLLALGGSTPILFNKCILKKSTPEKLSGSISSRSIVIHKSDLPKGIDIDMYTLKSIPIESVPSCKKAQYDSLYLEDSKEMSCLKEVLISILPVRLGLGVALSEAIDF